MREAKPSLTEAAYRGIRAEILSVKLLPDEKLTITVLCDRLGYSLGAVREALSRLTSEGLVKAEPQRGFRVSPVSPVDLIDLPDTRVWRTKSVTTTVSIERSWKRQSPATRSVRWSG